MKFSAIATLAPGLCALMAVSGAAMAQSAPGQPAPKPALGTPAPKPAVEAPAPVVSEDTVVLTVGDLKMTRRQYEDLIKAMPQNMRGPALGPQKRQMADRIAEAESLAQEAKKRKIEDRPEVKEITQLQVNSMLAGFLYQDILETTKLDEAAVKSYYDAHKEDYDEAKFQHILIRFKGSRVPLQKDQKDLTPEEALVKAQEIQKKIAGGADFAAEAKAESDDKGSAEKGGVLGDWMTRDQLVAEFSRAAFALPIGQVSEPVKTPFGYHLIKVVEKRTRTLEDVRPSIEQKMKPEIAAKKVEDIKKAYPVVVNNEYFGAAPAPAAPPSLLNPK